MDRLEDFNDGYYHFGQDLEDYPDAWCYIVWSKRGPGKTYSSLWYSYWNDIKVLYMKRTNDDVKRICMHKDDADFSPWVPINRDKGTDIIPEMLDKGIAAFYHSEEGNPTGPPIMYVASLNSSKTIKGFDLSQCDWIILDEFIPMAGEVVKHAEGEMLLDLYMTVSRDRQKRGRKPLKLVLFANAEEISTPITNELEVVDTMAEMEASGASIYYDSDRGILYHHITDIEVPLSEEEKEGIYNAMQGTKWHAKAFGGSFANNDFSNVKRLSVNKAHCQVKVRYKQTDLYVYLRDDGKYYMCDIPSKNFNDEYDLNLENDRSRFFADYLMDFKEYTIQDMMKYQRYSMYDLIMNFSKIYR